MKKVDQRRSVRAEILRMERRYSFFHRQKANKENANNNNVGHNLRKNED